MEEAAEVADKLGRLPLALTLAGGFLADQVIDPWSMTEYARNLDSGTNLDAIELIDQGARAPVGNDSRHLVSQTWQLSVSALVNQGLPEAADLLRLLACWSGDPLPLSLLSGARLGPELSARRVELALRGLLDQSLTELVPGDARCLRTHGVLLDSVARGTPPDRRETLAEMAVNLLAAALPELPQRGTQDTRLSLLAPHTVALLRRITHWPSVGQSTMEAAAECVLRLVVALHRTGDYATALSLANEAVQFCGIRLGYDHLMVLKLEVRIGWVLFRLGRFEESEELLRRTLTQCERASGSMAQVTLDCCLGLARTQMYRDQAPAALALIRRMVAGRTESLGPSHPLSLIARAYHVEWAPEVPEAHDVVDTGPDLIADCHREVGRSHPIALLAQLNYGRALFLTERPAEALPVAEQALSAHERLYGTEYPVTLAARHLFAAVLAAVGERHAAIVHLETVIAGRTRALGRSHPYTVAAQDLLAQCQRSRRPISARSPAV